MSELFLFLSFSRNAISPAHGHFLKEQKHEFVDRFSDDKWIAKLLFFANFFSLVNQWNGSMHGKDKNILDVRCVDAFKAKIKLWIHRMESGKMTDCFSSVELIF